MKKLKASIMVEAAIVYPIFFAILIAMIMVAFGMYQQTCARYAADTSVRLVQKKLINDNFDLNSGNLTSSDSLGLYRRLLGVSNDSIDLYRNKDGLYHGADANKIYRDIENLVTDRFLSRSLIAPSSIHVEIETKNYIIYQSIKISMKANYQTGIGLVDAFLGDSEYGFIVTASAEEMLTEGAEFIRNTDFMGDVSLMIPGVRETSANYEAMLNKFVDEMINGKED